MEKLTSHFLEWTELPFLEKPTFLKPLYEVEGFHHVNSLYLSLSSPLSPLSPLRSDFEPCDWSKRFRQVILTNQIQAVNATSTWRQAGTRLVGEQRRPKRQPVPSNVKPCNYKHKTFDSRKCTEAGINSRITVPSRVRASQDPTSAPLPRQVLFVYN